MEIVNKVAQSGLITIDLEDLYPKGERILFDIKDWLFMQMILKEKDFREKIATHNWEQYRDKYVAITCSADAIIPTWAFMLLAVQLQPLAKKVVYGNLENLENIVFNETLNSLDIEQYKDGRIIIKGCGKLPVPKYAYVELTRLLKPVAKSIMYGEPCSTVPLYKRK